MKRNWVGFFWVLVLCVATYAWGGVRSDSANLNPAPAGIHDPGGNYLTPADQEMLRQFGPLADKITGLTAQIATHGDGRGSFSFCADAQVPVRRA